MDEMRDHRPRTAGPDQVDGMAKPGNRDLGQWFLDTGDDAIAAGLLRDLETLAGEAEQ
jgi:hypothetical protein